MTSQAPKIRKPSSQQLIIGRLVKSEFYSQKGFWPKEMKMANKLIKEYDLDFLLWVIPPYNKKVPSLAYFMADYGKEYLSSQFFNFKNEKTDLTPKANNIQLSETKIGEDVVLDKKPRTLKDFLNLFNK